MWDEGTGSLVTVDNVAVVVCPSSMNHNKVKCDVWSMAIEFTWYPPVVDRIGKKMYTEMRCAVADGLIHWIKYMVYWDEKQPQMIPSPLLSAVFFFAFSTLTSQFVYVCAWHRPPAMNAPVTQHKRMTGERACNRPRRKTVGDRKRYYYVNLINCNQNRWRVLDKNLIFVFERLILLRRMNNEYPST